MVLSYFTKCKSVSVAVTIVKGLLTQYRANSPTLAYIDMTMCYSTHYRPGSFIIYQK